MGKSTKELFDFAALDSTELAVKVDVGASSYWSELGTVQTLDTMLQQKIITPIQYLERLPDTIFPNKTGLLEELKAGDKQKQVLYDAMGQFMMTLPPEQQQGIKNMPKEEQETAVLDMMIQAKSQQPSPNAVAPQMA
jgi:hypothetical protein